MAKKKAKRKIKPFNEDAEWLPPFILWLAHHPLLMYTEEDLSSEDMPARKRNALLRDGVKYEKENECPSQMAKNMFMHYRGSGGKLEKLFFNASRHYSDYIRKKAKKVEQEEDEAIADLKKVFTAALGAGL